MTNELQLTTFLVEREGTHLVWPSDISEYAYTLVYSHSKLHLHQGKPELHANTLYEAWAFDGKTSWHIWKRNDEWVCTTYHASDVNRSYVVQRKQILMQRFQQSTGKNVLVVHHHLNFDDDGQAYIAYSCPIRLEKEEWDNVKENSTCSV